MSSHQPSHMVYSALGLNYPHDGALGITREQQIQSSFTKCFYPPMFHSPLCPHTGLGASHFPRGCGPGLPSAMAKQVMAGSEELFLASSCAWHGEDGQVPP